MQEADIAENYTLPAGIILHNKYRIDQILGRGGFAIIYQCVNLSTGGTVAVKEYFPSGLAKYRHEQGFFCVQPFRKNLTEFQTGYRHFLEEARILKDCRDLPGIVTVYDFFEENQTAYIVMEYIDGLTLEQYVQTNGVLSPSEAFELLLPLLHSLKKVHEKGLIHRDISPNNIILGIDNKLHLIDFGAAKIKSVHPHQQQTIILKKGYAPPEQYMASGNVGTWSDTYALCATMYYALSGQTPVPAIDRLQQNELHALSDFNNLPLSLAAIIERGLALQPSARYKTLDDLIYALEHPDSLENGYTLMESSPKSKQTSHQFPRRILLGLAGTGLAIVLMALTYTFRIDSLHTPSVPKTIANTASPTPSSSPAATAPVILMMEDVTGLSQKAAAKKIRTLDSSITIKIKKKYDTSQTKGLVISQSITKGTVFNAGSLSQVTLTISRGAKPASPIHTTKPTTPPKSVAKNKNTTDFDMNSQRKSGSFEMD